MQKHTRAIVIGGNPAGLWTTRVCEDGYSGVGPVCWKD